MKNRMLNTDQLNIFQKNLERVIKLSSYCYYEFDDEEAGEILDKYDECLTYGEFLTELVPMMEKFVSKYDKTIDINTIINDMFESIERFEDD
jgi:CO/xanthine dehydrogenase FAD-binding subunit